ncbi:MAG: tryptophan-rich sensory protein [Anaerolineae bacterium]|nr:tryptophan-rich sensory protein [Anaerolineae bacterium]
MTRDMQRQFANILSWSAVLAFNFVSQALPLNGQTSAEIANRFANNFYFPANYAFSIWGVIYSFLLAFTIYQALPSQRQNPHVQRIGYLFVLTSIFNILWLTAFHYNAFALSMAMMIGLLVTLLRIYMLLDIGGKPVSTAVKWAVHIPFSLYLGWITAATVANASYVILDLNGDLAAASNITWAVVMLAVTGVLGVGMAVFRRDYAYSGVVIWAVFAIYSRFAAAEPTVATTSLIVCGATALALVVAFVNQRRSGGGGVLAGKAA